MSNKDRNTNDNLMKEIIIHLKTYGFIFQGSEIYSGLANSWDYGPLGILLKNNIKKKWWDFFITKSENNIGLDSSIIMNSKVWEASGHLSNFSDPLIDCKNCKVRFRVDKILNEFYPNLNFDGWSNDKLETFLLKHAIKCTKCHHQDWTEIRQFQLMFETYQGVLKKETNKIYLRPETAQGIFINFNNVIKSCKKQLPFGIGQIGKSFRNEITPSNFIFRTREFEQMELEFFFIPKSKTDTIWFDYWLKECQKFLINIGLGNTNNFFTKKHDQTQLAHYALATTDIEYNFPFGWEELCGISNRGNFDLTNHANFSGQNFAVQDAKTNQKNIPYVIEPSMGVERLLLAIICEAYNKEVLENNKKRLVLNLDKSITPYQVAVIPYNKKMFKDEAIKVFKMLQQTQIRVIYATADNMKKAYGYQDAVGTMYCIQVDINIKEKNVVKIRNRDTREMEIVDVSNLKNYLYEKLEIIV